ncbi:GNAT family N-acetyltransferase [Pleurocapsa sp. CCALA 161]|uniref:GNAT family N-acetyltransferase n=1 Tax=Pleurocapsa sp. CCALA 161 TaxID=2107688 RepID=UPI000D05C566|nr:GNAT family N-acetyltransferase [Pleurocapsa sp. CCALA 161]PSB12293.1 GNAT family N-acetyltransferase [Pleurocapsa sp. CCALA 161]
MNRFNIRQAEVDDVPQIFGLIKALAEYEKLSHQVTGSTEQLRKHLFGKRIYAEAIITEIEDTIVGFALFVPNYSTFLTKPGLYLEDLFVLPEYRRQGIGKAMLSYLGRLAIEREAGRLEWSVLDWNQSAIAFYQSLGAKVLPDWRICRVTDEALKALATIS